MKKSIWLVFYACLLLLFLFAGILIGRSSQTGYFSLPQPADDTQPTTQTNPENFGKIDLNRANIEDLVTLPGVGEVLAQRIIFYRMEHGGFQSVNDLLKVEGIGEKKFNEIAQYVYAGG